MSLHLWLGEFVSDDVLFQNLEHFPLKLSELLSAKIDLNSLVFACDQLSRKMKSDSKLRNKFSALIREAGPVSERDIEDTFESLSGFLAEENLHAKLVRELGTKMPFSPKRITYSDHVFECWAPVGFLVHAAPTNSIAVGVLSVVEGLLAGNVNFLKTSASDTSFPQHFLYELVHSDPGGRLKNFVIAAKVSSRQRSVLEKVFSLADGVSAWGGEESIEGLRSLTPKGARFVDWGPKISFAYVCASSFDDFSAAKKIANDICIYDQQACSSPQVVYLDTDDRTVLHKFASILSDALREVSTGWRGLSPDVQEQAEITNVTELARLGQCLDENLVIEAADKGWRVLVEYKSGLRASPLYRTIWVKPLPKAKVVSVLHPLRSYLQTVGIAGNSNELADVAAVFARAGLQRMNLVGAMHKSYMGEPHDGRYALQAYARKLSFQFDERMAGVSDLDDLTAVPFVDHASNSKKIMTKEDFQSAVIEDRYAQLYFKSGGSSGEPKLSVFTYDDYHAQMAAAAEGLYAAGLNPVSDRCMNLFFGGGLYGGFVSFFSILEYLKAVQFPMAVVDDFAFVADMIVSKRVNVLLGMPSFLTQLFSQEKERLKKYSGIKKIFYGGEHFNAKQVEYLKKEFGVEVIKSATYGSVDAGPLGYQCAFSKDGVHHLHASLQELEVLALEEDKAAEAGEAGRLIFSSKIRQGQKISRYEIGDLGRLVAGLCQCGRVAPRFELLGRHGDICRVGTTFLNYRKICNIVGDYCDYAGEIQLILRSEGPKEVVTLRMQAAVSYEENQIRKTILANYKDVAEVVAENLLELTVEFVEQSKMIRSPGSGKLRHIVDGR